MAESVADKLKALDKQRSAILDAFVNERQALIKAKKDELAKLESELHAILSPAASSRKSKLVDKGPSKARRTPKTVATNEKKDAAKLPSGFSNKELKGIIEGLSNGITEPAELKQFVEKGRRMPLIVKAIEAYQSLGPKDRSPEALQTAMKSLKAKKQD